MRSQHHTPIAVQHDRSSFQHYFTLQFTATLHQCCFGILGRTDLGQHCRHSVLDDLHLVQQTDLGFVTTVLDALALVAVVEARLGDFHAVVQILHAARQAIDEQLGFSQVSKALQGNYIFIN